EMTAVESCVLRPIGVDPVGGIGPVAICQLNDTGADDFPIGLDSTSHFVVVAGVCAEVKVLAVEGGVGASIGVVAVTLEDDFVVGSDNQGLRTDVYTTDGSEIQIARPVGIEAEQEAIAVGIIQRHDDFPIALNRQVAPLGG